MQIALNLQSFLSSKSVLARHQSRTSEESSPQDLTDDENSVIAVCNTHSRPNTDRSPHNKVSKTTLLLKIGTQPHVSHNASFFYFMKPRVSAYHPEVQTPRLINKPTNHTRYIGAPPQSTYSRRKEKLTELKK